MDDQNEENANNDKFAGKTKKGILNNPIIWIVAGAILTISIVTYKEADKYYTCKARMENPSCIPKGSDFNGIRPNYSGDACMSYDWFEPQDVVYQCE